MACRCARRAIPRRTRRRHGNGTASICVRQSYYANSLRAFLGADVRQDLNLGDFFLQPDVRLGYRFDFLNDPIKLNAQFADIDSP